MLSSSILFKKGKNHDDVNHVAGKEFKCSECDKSVSSERNLDKHKQTHHKSCKSCRLVFDTVAEKENHMALNHVVVGSVNYNCEICNKYLSSSRNLENHIQIIHKTCSVCKVEFSTESEKEK